MTNFRFGRVRSPEELNERIIDDIFRLRRMADAIEAGVPTTFDSEDWADRLSDLGVSEAAALDIYRTFSELPPGSGVRITDEMIEQFRTDDS